MSQNKGKKQFFSGFNTHAYNGQFAVYCLNFLTS